MTLPKLLLLWSHFVAFGERERINLTCKVSFVGSGDLPFPSPSPFTYILAMKKIVVGRAPFRIPPKLVATLLKLVCLQSEIYALTCLFGTLFMILSFKVWYGKPLKLLLKSF